MNNGAKKKVLVLNGSPRGEHSTTVRLANAMADGIRETADTEVKVVNIVKQNIESCRGCYCCWKVTPGKCAIKDDMAEILDDYIAADIIIWSFPLYYHSMPSKTMAVMERTLPFNCPEIENGEDGNYHPARYDFSKKRIVMISTCGFATRENNFEAVVKQFEITYGDIVTTITVPEGGGFNFDSAQERVAQYLGYFKDAGKELARDGKISKETRAKVDELLMPAEMYREQANYFLTKQESKDGND